MKAQNATIAIIAILFSATILAGCLSGNPQNQSVAPIPAAKVGDVVQVDYTLYLSNGTVFDTSMQSEAVAANANIQHPFGPLNLTIGSGQFLPAFENAIVGMQVGQSKNITLTPQQGYGVFNPALVLNVSVSQLVSAGITPAIGTQVYLRSGQGAGVITNITNGTAYINFNSPLAGQTLTFTIILRSIDGNATQAS
jgi:FKBP-type peptidyl-prolyl cis-trans isomerase 2